MTRGIWPPKVGKYGRLTLFQGPFCLNWEGGGRGESPGKKVDRRHVTLHRWRNILCSAVRRPSPIFPSRSFPLDIYRTKNTQTAVQNNSYLPQRTRAFAYILVPLKTSAHVTIHSLTLWYLRNLSTPLSVWRLRAEKTLVYTDITRWLVWIIDILTLVVNRRICLPRKMADRLVISSAIEKKLSPVKHSSYVLFQLFTGIKGRAKVDVRP